MYNISNIIPHCQPPKKTNLLPVRKNKNNNRYIGRSDFPVIFQKLVPNQQWHPKYAKMLLTDDGHFVVWLADWVLKNKRITDKCRYFAKCCGKLAWSKTKKFISRLIKIKEQFFNQPDWWHNWVAVFASDFMLTECQNGHSPPKLLSYLVKREQQK